MPCGTILRSPVRGFVQTASGTSGAAATPRRSASRRVTRRTRHLQPQPFGGIHSSQNGLSTGRISPALSA
jgi:hypothetical protein